MHFRSQPGRRMWGNWPIAENLIGKSPITGKDGGKKGTKWYFVFLVSQSGRPKLEGSGWNPPIEKLWLLGRKRLDVKEKLINIMTLIFSIYNVPWVLTYMLVSGVVLCMGTRKLPTIVALKSIEAALWEQRKATWRHHDQPFWHAAAASAVSQPSTVDWLLLCSRHLFHWKNSLAQRAFFGFILVTKDLRTPSQFSGCVRSHEVGKFTNRASANRSNKGTDIGSSMRESQSKERW